MREVEVGTEGRRPETDGRIPIDFSYVARRCRMSQDRTRQKHNAHGPEVIKIHYQFHPLFGQSLRVQRRMNGPKGEYLFCELVPLRVQWG